MHHAPFNNSVVNPAFPSTAVIHSALRNDCESYSKINNSVVNGTWHMVHLTIQLLVEISLRIRQSIQVLLLYSLYHMSDA